MNRRQQWTLAALALALAAGAARAQPGASSSPVPAPAGTWEFTTTRADGEARLQMQAGRGATAICEKITMRMAATPVTLTTDGQKVRVSCSAGERGGLRIEASADRVRWGGADVLTLAGEVQARFDRQGQFAQFFKAEKVTVDLRTGNLRFQNGGSAARMERTPVSLDFGFPVVPAAEKAQAFNFSLGFSR